MVFNTISSTEKYVKSNDRTSNRKPVGKHYFLLIERKRVFLEYKIVTSPF